MGKFKATIINLFIVLLLMGNFHGMLMAWKVRLGKYAGAQFPYFSNLFYIYSVFSTKQEINCIYIAIGATAKKDTGSGTPVNEYIDLKLQDYFPQSHGEASMRMSHLGNIDKLAVKQVKYEPLASALQHSYNKKHADKPVSRVFIYQFYWPSDYRGYHFREQEGKLLLLGSN